MHSRPTQSEREMKRLLMGVVLAGAVLTGGGLLLTRGQLWVSPPPLDAPVIDATPDATTVVAVGDLSCERNNPEYNLGMGTDKGCRAQATSDLALNLHPELVLAIGDEQYRSGKLIEFDNSYDKTWGRLKAITKPVPGNHEYGTKGAAGYFDYFGVTAGAPKLGYYSFDADSWHIVALNGNCQQVGGCQVKSPETTWLRQDLAGHTNACTLAFIHQPPFSSGGHGTDISYRPLWQALQDYQADVVLAGHDHDYERFEPLNAEGKPDPKGPREFVVGTGGESLTAFRAIQDGSLIRDNQDYGVMKLVLRAGEYSWQFITTGKEIKDTGMADCYAKTHALKPTPGPGQTQG